MLLQGLFKASTEQVCMWKSRRESGKKHGKISTCSQRTEPQLEMSITKESQMWMESTTRMGICKSSVEARGGNPVVSSDGKIDDTDGSSWANSSSSGLIHLSGLWRHGLFDVSLLMILLQCNGVSSHHFFLHIVFAYDKLSPITRLDILSFL